MRFDGMLSDFTFLIPVRIDSPERLENLQLVLKHYEGTGVRILVGEEDATAKCADLQAKHIDYSFFQTDERYFYKTKILNALLKQCNSKFVSTYDCDVLLPHSQLVETIELLESGADMVYPYDGGFLDVYRDQIPKISNKDFDVTAKLMHNHSVGGVVAYWTRVYRNAGGENENFVSWGQEDVERHERIAKLGYKVDRAKGKCYHLSHPRGENSWYSNPFYKQCNEEYKKVSSMETEDLRQYIKSEFFYTESACNGGQTTFDRTQRDFNE